MAALTNAGSPTKARRILMTLLHGLAGEWIAETKPPDSGRKSRRYYPPRRDRVIEDAAMSREMYRL